MYVFVSNLNLSSLVLTFALFSSFTSSYFGLVSFWIGRETDDKEWIARGKKSKVSIEKLAALASTWNFQNSEFGYLTCYTSH